MWERYAVSLEHKKLRVLHFAEATQSQMSSLVERENLKDTTVVN